MLLQSPKSLFLLGQHDISIVFKNTLMTEQQWLWDVTILYTTVYYQWHSWCEYYLAYATFATDIVEQLARTVVEVCTISDHKTCNNTSHIWHLLNLIKPNSRFLHPWTAVDLYLDSGHVWTRMHAHIHSPIHTCRTADTDMFHICTLINRVVAR